MDGGTGAAAAKERDEGVPRYRAQMGGKEVGEVPTVPYRTGPVPACSVVLCSAQCPVPVPTTFISDGREWAWTWTWAWTRAIGAAKQGTRPGRKEAPKAGLAQHDTAQQSAAQHSTVLQTWNSTNPA